MACWHIEHLPATLRHPDFNLHVLARDEVSKAEGLNDVARADAQVVGLFGEPERKDALFLRG